MIDFFFKPKKYNLLLMPLIKKSSSYKDEALFKSKALAWLHLIETTNERLGDYVSTVLIPFFNMSFGYHDSNQNLDSESFDLVGRYKQDHEFASLNQIAIEAFVSVLYNGNMNSLPVEFKRKFSYGTFF